jgi:hypothetical protein
VIQPTIHQWITDILDMNDDFSVMPFVYMDDASSAIAVAVASDTLSGILLSPLELARTR